MAMSRVAIPFKSETIASIVRSEVIEHIRDDEQALREMARVLERGGNLILAVPIHRYNFSHDDIFVKHHRRYGLPSLLKTLRLLGFSKFRVVKITGLLEKITMISAVLIFQPASRFKREGKNSLFKEASSGLSMGQSAVRRDGQVGSTHRASFCSRHRT